MDPDLFSDSLFRFPPPTPHYYVRVTRLDRKPPSIPPEMPLPLFSPPACPLLRPLIGVRPRKLFVGPYPPPNSSFFFHPPVGFVGSPSPDCEECTASAGESVRHFFLPAIDSSSFLISPLPPLAVQKNLQLAAPRSGDLSRAYSHSQFRFPAREVHQVFDARNFSLTVFPFFRRSPRWDWHPFPNAFLGVSTIRHRPGYHVVGPSLTFPFRFPPLFSDSLPLDTPER